MKQVEVFINGRLPDLNELEKQARHNPYSAGKFRDKWRDYICIELRGIRFYRFNNIFFEIIYYEKDRRRDKDNIAGGAKKLIFDALVKMQIIKNDGWSEIAGWKEDFQVNKEYQGVYLKLIETKED